MSSGSGFSLCWRTFGPYPPWPVLSDDGKQLFAFWLRDSQWPWSWDRFGVDFWVGKKNDLAAGFS